eukprot:763755-Hanusia_phi.AAC.1
MRSSVGKQGNNAGGGGGSGGGEVEKGSITEFLMKAYLAWTSLFVNVTEKESLALPGCVVPAARRFRLGFDPCSAL